MAQIAKPINIPDEITFYPFANNVLWVLLNILCCFSNQIPIIPGDAPKQYDLVIHLETLTQNCFMLARLAADSKDGEKNSFNGGDIMIKNFLGIFICLILGLGLFGCATRGNPIQSSVYLLDTDKSTTGLLNDLANDLRTSKYEVETINNSLGILSLMPRRFVIPREGGRSYGEQIFQLRQEGGSVKVTITYRCEDAEKGGMGPCYDRDQAANNKINRIEKALLEVLNKQMYRTRSGSIPKAKEI